MPVAIWIRAQSGVARDHLRRCTTYRGPGRASGGRGSPRRKKLLRIHRSPSPRTIPAALRFAFVKAVAVTVALVFGYVSAAVFADFRIPSSEGAPTAEQAAAELLIENQCTSTGLLGASAHSALVRRDGQLFHVTLEEGNAVYQGRSPGTVVAVCRRPVTA